MLLYVSFGEAHAFRGRGNGFFHRFWLRGRFYLYFLLYYGLLGRRVFFRRRLFRGGGFFYRLFCLGFWFWFRGRFFYRLCRRFSGFFDRFFRGFFRWFRRFFRF